MKRHQQLQALSREHHSALKLALRARRAALSSDPGKIELVATACVAAFTAELDAHFLVEENTLLPMLVQSGANELVQRLEQDHGDLRALVIQLQHPDAATLLAFADCLAAHVRFEERDMFEVLEVCFQRENVV